MRLVALGKVSSYGIVLRDWQLPVLKLHSTGPRLRNQPKMPPIVFLLLLSHATKSIFAFYDDYQRKGRKKF